MDLEIALLEQLDKVQRLSHTPFGVPELIPDADVPWVARAHQLLHGESIELPDSVDEWTLTTTTDDACAASGLAVGNPCALKYVVPDFGVVVCGHLVPLGDAEISMPDAEVVRVTPAAGGPGHVVTVRPLTSPAHGTMRLVNG